MNGNDWPICYPHPRDSLHRNSLFITLKSVLLMTRLPLKMMFPLWLRSTLHQPARAENTTWLKKLATYAVMLGLISGLLALPLQAQACSSGCPGGGQGATVAAGAGAVTSNTSQVMGNVTNVSDSLWGNLLLSMAYQRDPVIQQSVKKLGRTNSLTLLAITGISGLGLAQGIVALNNVQGAQTLDVVTHADGDSHVHTMADSRVPSTLGIIGSGATVATLLVKAFLERRYSRRISSQQHIIKQQVETILSTLEAGGPVGQATTDLSPLVGQKAALEFAQLWRVAHP
jgi:hypothetical protein